VTARRHQGRKLERMGAYRPQVRRFIRKKTEELASPDEAQDPAYVSAEVVSVLVEAVEDEALPGPRQRGEKGWKATSRPGGAASALEFADPIKTVLAYRRRQEPATRLFAVVAKFRLEGCPHLLIRACNRDHLEPFAELDRRGEQLPLLFWRSQARHLRL